MSLDLYLATLNTSTAVNTAGTFTGNDYDVIGSTDAILYYQTPVANWKPIFLFKTDGTTDITTETVSVSTAQGLNFIGNSGATSSLADTSSLYQASTALKSTGDNYTNYFINDSSRSIGDVTDPDANLDFMSNLAAAIFGSPHTIDMLTNEGALSTSYAEAINIMANTVTQTFAVASVGDTPLSDITQLSATNLRVCKQIYQQMRFSVADRFTLAYSSSITSPAFNDGIVCAVSRTPAAGGAAVDTSATVDVFMTGADIDHIVIRGTDNIFSEDDKITISQVGPPIFYTPSTDITVGTANINGGFLLKTTPCQLNLLRNTMIAAYSTANPPIDSVEYFNGNQTVDAGGAQLTANFLAPDNYTLLINEAGYMNVYTAGNPTPVVEDFTTWTMTGNGQTILRGTISKAVNASGDTVTTLLVKDREYGTAVASFFSGEQMYTEVLSYSFTGTLATDTVLTVAVDTSPTGPVGVQIGDRDQTIDVAQINSVQRAILNDTLTSYTQLPVQASDVFNIKLFVSNNSGQINVAGRNLDTIGNTVTRTAVLKINLSAS